MKPLDVGQVVNGRLELRRVLRVGPAGAVYEALDLARGVALELIPWSKGEEALKTWRSRYATLSGERVLEPALDGWLILGPLPPGPTLEDWLAEPCPGRDPRALATAIGTQLAVALDRVHGSGAPHGGLSTACIFITRDEGAAPEVQVGDFGLARADGPDPIAADRTALAQIVTELLGASVAETSSDAISCLELVRRLVEPPPPPAPEPVAAVVPEAPRPRRWKAAAGLALAALVIAGLVPAARRALARRRFSAALALSGELAGRRDWELVAARLEPALAALGAVEHGERGQAEALLGRALAAVRRARAARPLAHAPELAFRPVAQPDVKVMEPGDDLPEPVGGLAEPSPKPSPAPSVLASAPTTAPAPSTARREERPDDNPYSDWVPAPRLVGRALGAERGPHAPALAFAARGAYPAALAWMGGAIERAPAKEAFNDRALVHLLAGDPDAAIGDYERALALDGAYGPARFGRGRAFMLKGDATRALADLDVARVPGAEAQRRANRARCLHLLNRLAAALDEFAVAARCGPLNAECAFFHAEALLAAGRAAEAAAWYADAARLAPRYRDAHLGRGMALARTGKLAPADAALGAALAIDPACALAYAERAVVRAGEGRADAARADLDRAAALEPARAAAVGPAVRAALGRRIEAATAALAREPGDAASYLLRGECRAMLGDYEPALADLDAAMRASPARAELRLSRQRIVALARASTNR